MWIHHQGVVVHVATRACDLIITSSIHYVRVVKVIRLDIVRISLVNFTISWVSSLRCQRNVSLPHMITLLENTFHRIR